MTPKDQLIQFGAVQVKDVVSKEMSHFLTGMLMLSHKINPGGDEQIPNAMAVMPSNIVFDRLLEQAWPFVEAVVGEELIPTYSYARLYGNGDVLEKHTDRDSCEVSVTVQLGRSHHYSWPITMGGKTFFLGEGDGVIYRGCDIEHWRAKCEGPDGYYSGQVFLHYVYANGPRKEYAGDKRWEKVPFERFRDELMAGK